MSTASPTANDHITAFIEGLSDRLRNNFAFLAVMFVQPRSFGAEDIDWWAEAKALINPAADDGFRRHGAAITWAAHIDYFFARFVPPVSSADMLALADRYEAESGTASGMRRLAADQDAANAAFAAAAAKWASLRAGPLSIFSLQQEWDRERGRS